MKSRLQAYTWLLHLVTIDKSVPSAEESEEKCERRWEEREGPGDSVTAAGARAEIPVT